MYIAPGQGQTPLGDKFWCQQKFLLTFPICCQFKTNLFEVWFFTVFLCVFFFHMYIAPGKGRQPIGDKNFMTTERPFLFARMLQVSKWSLWNLILYTFLMILYMYIAPGQGQKTPWGQTFDVNRKPLSLQPFVASFKLISLNSDLHINVFPHVYSPWAGPLVDKILMSTEKPCHFAICWVSKKISLKFDFIHNFSCFYTCI